jgi:hypothetical protein
LPGAALALVGSGVVFAQNSGDMRNYRVRISGRLMDPSGAPVTGGDVELYEYATGILVHARATDTGRFTLTGYQFQRSNLLPLCGGTPYRPPPKFIDVAGTNVDIGDVRLSPAPDPPVRHPYIELKGDLTLDQIIVDPRVEQPLDWRLWRPLPIPGDSQARAGTIRLPERNRDVTIEQFIGGKVTQIRVVRFWRLPKVTLADIREEVRRVWLGRFSNPTLYMGWSEGGGWNVEAKVLFEDGKETSILMDDWVHVQVEDREGRFWFIRLRPAVD